MLGVWGVMVVSVTAMFEPTTEVIAIGPPELTLNALAGTDTRILSVSKSSVKLSGQDRGFVRQLYANGVRLVLPSLSGGCMGLGFPRT
jgi:hypothetical protein